MVQFGPGSSHSAKVVMTNPTSGAFDYSAILYMGVNKAAMAEASFHLNAGESKEVTFGVVMPTTVGEYPVYLSVFSGGVLLGHYQSTENVTIVAVAPPFDPWVYDLNGDGYIDDSERTKAASDYFDGVITKEQMLQVLNLPSPPALPFSFSNLSVQRVRCQSSTAWNTLNFSCTITNPTSVSITHTLTPMYRVGTKYGYSDPISREEFARTITIPPGGSYNYYLPGNQPALDRCTIIIGYSAGVPYGGCVFLRDENGNDSPQKCV